MGIGPIFAIPDLLAKTGISSPIKAKRYKISTFGSLTKPLQVRQFTAPKSWESTKIK
jgi:hypothetical protein